jgi:hypothetical protein
MIFSPARAIANRQNSLKSTGPKTEEGKARSRANALKHGLSGAGVVLPGEDGAEVARRFDGLRAQFQPSTPAGQILVHRLAFLSLRLERAAEQEAAHLGEVIRHAREDHNEAREDEVEDLLDALTEHPARSVRKLLKSPEGVEALATEWLALRSDLARTNGRTWTAAHHDRANHLTGRRPDALEISRVDELSRAIDGDFSLLDDADGAGLDPEDRRGWAREAMLAFIDEEVAAIRSCGEQLDLCAFDRDRDDAGRRALFDPSKEATLARRYEAAAERGLFRTLNEVRKVEAEAQQACPDFQVYPVPPLASFRPEPVDPNPATAEPEPTPEPREVSPRLNPLPTPVGGELRGGVCVTSRLDAVGGVPSPGFETVSR